MGITIWKLHKVFQRIQEKDLKPWTAFFVILIVLVWASVWLACFCTYTFYKGEKTDFRNLRMLTIMDMVSTASFAINCGIMALILYRSLKVAQHNQ